MLSNEMASSLGGRFIVKEVDTLSFAEFLTFKEVQPGKNYQYSEQRFEIKKMFDEWLTFGGFPEILKYQDKKEYLNTIFLKVFLGDIISRYQVRNKFALQLMVKKLAESAADEVSFNRIRHIIQSTNIKVGTATIIEYMNYLEDSFLIRSLKNYQHKISGRETKKKYYFRDHGLLNLFLHEPSSIELETIVFNYLASNFTDQMYYLRDSLEVDFFIPEKQLIQVCDKFNSIDTMEREMRSLLKAAKTYKVKELIIITLDEEDILKEEGMEISVIPVWRWMLRGGNKTLK